MTYVTHESIPPFWNKDSKVLILGSVPSPKSREYGFYYMHPYNRFWKVLSEVFQEEFPVSIEEKKAFLKKRQLALWDVVFSCEIEGASDTSIRKIKENDLTGILQKSQISSIFVTGKKAYELYYKYCYPKVKIEAIYLPSTSPANASFSLEKLKKEYQKIVEVLKRKN